MKKWFSIFIILLCIGSIVAGNIHWKQKLSAKAELVKQEKQKEPVVTKEQVEEKPTNEEKQETDLETRVAAYTKNLPTDIQDKFAEAAKSEKPLQLVIFGSDSTPSEKGAWPDLLSQQLIKAYSDKVIKITTISMGDQTSLDVIRSKGYEQVSELKPDIVLFEPFTLKDNTGKIAMKNRVGSVQKMLEAWKSSHEHVSVLLQPANPVHEGINYPKQVEEIKAYADEEAITYVNHWDGWPKTEDDKMLEYLTEDSLPNEKGHQLWADYLIEYFIAD